MIEKTELPDFIGHFLSSVYRDSIPHVEFAGAPRGQFRMSSGVRQGCPASGFLFATLDLQMASTGCYSEKSTHSGLVATCPMCMCRRPSCGCSVFSGLDDCARSGISIRGSYCWPQSELSEMLWVQYGTEEHESLWHWVSENCGEFCEMQIVAKKIGTMIVLDGYLHRWTAPRKRSSSA